MYWDAMRLAATLNVNATDTLEASADLDDVTAGIDKTMFVKYSLRLNKITFKYTVYSCTIFH